MAPHWFVVLLEKQQVRPDVIAHAAAYTPEDSAEAEPKTARRLNTE